MKRLIEFIVSMVLIFWIAPPLYAGDKPLEDTTITSEAIEGPTLALEEGIRNLAVLTKAIRELKAENDALTEQNEAQQSRVTELEEENQALRRTMQSIEIRLSALEKNSLLYGSALDRYTR